MGLSRKWRATAQFASATTANEMHATLGKIFATYTTANLHGVSPQDFAKSIQSRIGAINIHGEDYSADELERQRDLSIRYHWGHNHDFGSFQLEGRMGDRHIRLLANFIAFFPVSLDDFTNKCVFDIGCWTGGTTLLLASLASKVYAIEEVKMYAETASFLSQSFGRSNVSVEPISIYSCNSERFYDQFDIAYFPGVIYHLSDPLLALRIIFNSLKVGGFILVESAGVNVEDPYCRFDGSLIYSSGHRGSLNRSGWNWFVPSPSALHRMMKEAGFDDIRMQWHQEANRIYGFGRKLSQVGMCKAGLSVPNIR